MPDPVVREAADRLVELVPDRRPVLLAVSGGADSLAMLHLLAEGRELHRVELTVGHVDHGISPESAGAMALVERAAGSAGLEFRSASLRLGSGASETAARTARRRALVELADRAGAVSIATAHHAGDQVETVLMRVLRGSGPAGLAGIAGRTGRWIRPLLGIRGEELREYLGRMEAAWWEDPANRDPRHLRSWIRTELLPTIEARLPDAGTRLLRLAGQAASARRGWDQLLEELPGLDPVEVWGGITVSLDRVVALPHDLRWQVIGALFRRAGGAPVSRRQAIDRLLAGGRSGRMVRAADGVVVSADRDRLVVVRLEADRWEPVAVAPGSRLELGPVRLRCVADRAPEAAERAGEAAWLRPGDYVARPWQSGDRVRPLGGTGSRPVAVLLREGGVPSVLRDRWPVVVPVGRPATIVWVPGICRSDELLPAAGEEAWRVDAQRRR